MTNKKIWAATLFSTLLLTMTISSPVKAAELQTSTTVDRSQITLPLSEETEENLFSLESVSDIQMSELVDPDEVISVSDGDDTIQARKGTATKYGWSYGTTPYTFTQKQKYIQHIHIIMMGYFIQPQQNYWMHLAIHSIVLR